MTGVLFLILALTGSIYNCEFCPQMKDCQGASFSDEILIKQKTYRQVFGHS